MASRIFDSGGTGGGGGAVDSVFGRVGVVVAKSGDYDASEVTNDSGVAGATVAAALDTLAAADLVLSNDAPGELGTADAGNDATPSRDDHVHPTALTSRTSENVTLNLVPDQVATGTVNTGSSVTFDITLATGRMYLISVQALVTDATGADGVPQYFRSKLILARRQSSGDAIVDATSIVMDPYSTAAFTFVASVNGSNVRLTLSNTSGTNRPYNVIAGWVSFDKP